MTIEELKIRLLTNQHLITPTDKMSVLHDLCGVQAQFMILSQNRTIYQIRQERKKIHAAGDRGEAFCFRKNDFQMENKNINIYC